MEEIRPTPTVTIDLYDYDQLLIKEQLHDMLVESLLKAIKKPYPHATRLDLEFTDAIKFLLEKCAPYLYREAVEIALNEEEAN